MFGIVTAALSSVSEAEKERYQATYCGLCRTLKERYGQAARAVLSYDLTFYILLCDALHEPAEQTGSAPCPAHPLKARPYATSPWTDHGADLAVALAYHKCLDDVHDDGTLRAKASERLLRSAYATARERIPKACGAIEEAMADIRAIEEEGTADPDAAAKRFGQLLGLLFAEGQGAWAGPMLAFGAQLGRLIYMMDAAVDYADDAASGSYNPFVALGSTPAAMQTALAVMADGTAAAFERLPLEQDLHLLRSIVYAGLWQRFNQTYQGTDLPLAPVGP